MQHVEGIERRRAGTAVSGLAAQWRAVSRSLAVALFLLASLVLVGRLASGALPTFVDAITFPTVSAWLLLSASVSLWLDDLRGGTLRRHSRWCALGTLVVDVVAMGAWAEHSLPTPTHAALGLGESAFMSPQAGVGFALLALSLLLLDWKSRSGSRPGQRAALVAAGIGLVAGLGYLNSVSWLYNADGMHPISLHESIALILLAAAVLAARPEQGLLRVVISDSAGGFLARRAPAVVVAVPMGLGWLALKGQRLGWYDGSAAISVLVFATIVFFGGLILRVARTLDRADLRHARAEELLRVRARQRAAVSELSQRALSGADSRLLAEEAVHLVVDALRVSCGEFVRAEDGEEPLVVQVGMGLDSSPEPGREGASLAARVLASGQPVVIEHLRSDHKLHEARLDALGVTSAAIAPVMSATRRYGILAAYSTDARSFTDDDVHQLQTVAGILAAARDRTLSEMALRRSEQKFSALFRSSPDAMALVTLSDHRFQEVNDGFLQMTGLVKDEAVGRTIDELSVWNQSSALLAAAEAQTPVRNLELQVTTRSGETRVGLCSAEVVTLEGESFLLVVVRDISERKRVQAAIQEANERLARWVNELEDRGREISVLSEMGELLQACQSADEACRITLKVAQQLLPGSSGAICMFAGERGLLEAAATWGGLSADEAVFGTQDCWALRRGRPHAASGPESGLVCAHVRHADELTYLCVPMIAQSEAIGVLHVRQPDAVMTGETMLAWLSEPRQRLVVAIADHTALALANLRLRETLRNQSIRDPLTGLHNRRYMHEVLERELLRARRAEWSIGVLLLDLDKFKAVNDTYGHDAGDEVLKGVSRLLQSRLRAEDIVCRHGGEEFVVVLPQMPLESTLGRAEEIRQAVKGLSVAYRQHAIGPISTSIGAAAFPEHGSTITSLLEAADGALYRAKAQGGDRVEPAVVSQFPTPHHDSRVKKAS